ncbi:MAG: hypothetical protein GWN00_37825, partial [Aliifodinibius sp.]|nr:hypothetical protein [Fodinibius sp.]NIV10431.1 hypothetical protein [Fodinibius sp.]NIY30336.1 hypothetical protein [Fodinibius sp.]
KSIEHQIIDKFMWGGVGDQVDNILTSKFGIVFLRFSSQEEMIEKTEQMQQLIRVVTDSTCE